MLVVACMMQVHMSNMNVYKLYILQLYLHIYMVMCVQVYGYLVSKFIFSCGDLLFLESQQTLPYFCQEKGFVGR